MTDTPKSEGPLSKNPGELNTSAERVRNPAENEHVATSPDYGMEVVARRSVQRGVVFHDDPTGEPLVRLSDASRIIATLQADKARMEEALLAFMEAGGANPRQGKVQFSTWSLDKLAIAFDKARAALHTGEGT